MAFPADWSRRVSVTGASPAATLSGYVALITGDNLPAEIWTTALNGGGDLRVALNSDGTSPIPLEVVSFDTSLQTAVLWVRFPTYSAADRECWIFYGKAGETQPAFTDPLGRNAVWVDYVGVYHCEDLNYTDSTGKYDLSLSGTNPPIIQSGKIGNAYNFDVGNTLLLNDTLTGIAATQLPITLQAIGTTPNSTSITNDTISIGGIAGTELGGRDFSIAVGSGTSSTVIDSYTPVNAGSRNQNTASPQPNSDYFANAIWRADGNIGLSGVVGTNTHDNENYSVSQSTIPYLRIGLGGRVDTSPIFAIPIISEFRVSLLELTENQIDIETDNYLSPATFWITGTPEPIEPAGGVTADSAFTLPAVAVASNAAATLPQPTAQTAFTLPALQVDAISAATLPQPDALASFTLPAVEMASIASATLPQPLASGAFTLPAYAVSATADATQPNPIAIGAFNLTSLTFSASASATSPSFESVVAFTLPGLAVEGQASATQPNPTASGFFTLPSLQVQANGTVTLPQPSASGAFTLPALDFSGNASVTEPVFTASGAFALPALTMTGQASATQPQPSASGAFNLPALRVNGNITVSGVVIQAGSEGTLYLDAGSNVIYVNAGDNTLHLH